MWINRLFPPPQACPTAPAALPRILLTGVFGVVALRVGTGYLHLCEAGSRVVEGSAVFLTPALVCAPVLFARRLPLAVLWAAAVLLTIYACRQPYLDLVHGK